MLHDCNGTASESADARMGRSAKARNHPDQLQGLECVDRQHGNVSRRSRESNPPGTSVTAVMSVGVTSRRERISTSDGVAAESGVPGAIRAISAAPIVASIMEVLRKYQLHFGDAPVSANCACVCCASDTFVVAD